jgi:hypothetical protein
LQDLSEVLHWLSGQAAVHWLAPRPRLFLQNAIASMIVQVSSRPHATQQSTCIHLQCASIDISRWTAQQKMCCVKHYTNSELHNTSPTAHAVGQQLAVQQQLRQALQGSQQHSLG